MKLILNQKDSILKLIAVFLKPHIKNLDVELSSESKDSCLIVEQGDKTNKFTNHKLIYETLGRAQLNEDNKNVYYCSVDDPEIKIAKFDQMLSLALESKPDDLFRMLPPNLSGPYVMGKQITIIDLACYLPLRDVMKSLNDESISRNKALISWFTMLQKSIESTLKSLDLDPIPLKYEAAKSTKNVKGKKADKSTNVLTISPKLIDLRVGLIKECQKHEQADSLYVEQIDVGEENPRTIVSGLVNHIPLSEMQNRLVVIVCNLKPVSMRGIKSYGMVLAATSSEGKVELVEPPANSKAGDMVYVEGYQNQEKEFDVLNPKKKIWETVQPGLKTNEEKQAVYMDGSQPKYIATSNGICTVKSVVNASIK